jgi:hypothetical protein
MGIDTYTVSIGMEDAGLKGAEKSTPARDSQYHAAQFAEGLLPLFEGDAFATAQIIKNGTETFVAMRGQCQGLVGGVDEPSKDDFRRAPAAVTFQQLFDGDRFLMESLGGVKRANDVVDGMEQDTTSNTTTVRIALNQVAEIVNVDIGVT